MLQLIFNLYNAYYNMYIYKFNHEGFYKTFYRDFKGKLIFITKKKLAV